MLKYLFKTIKKKIQQRNKLVAYNFYIKIFKYRSEKTPIFSKKFGLFFHKKKEKLIIYNKTNLLK